MAKYTRTQNEDEHNGQSVLKVCNNVNLHHPAPSTSATTVSKVGKRSTLRKYNVGQKISEEISQNDDGLQFIGIVNHSEEAAIVSDSPSKSSIDSVSLRSESSTSVTRISSADNGYLSSSHRDRSIKFSFEATSPKSTNALTVRKSLCLSPSAGILNLDDIENISFPEDIPTVDLASTNSEVSTVDLASTNSEVSTIHRNGHISNISHLENNLLGSKCSKELTSSKLSIKKGTCVKSQTNVPMSNVVRSDLDHESQPIIVSPLKSKEVFLDNGLLHSLMNVKGDNDEGDKTKRRSLKSKFAETGNNSPSVKRRRRFIHEFFSQNDTADKILTQNGANEIQGNHITLSDKINSVELVSVVSNGGEARTSDSPIVFDATNDSSVFIVENGIADDVIVISDSQSSYSPLISPNICTTIEENVTSQDESIKSTLLNDIDENVDSSPEKPDRIRSMSEDVFANAISPLKRSSPLNVARDAKRKSEVTAESTNTSPSSVSHSRSFRIVRLACNDDDDISWRFSREQNSKSLAANSTSSNLVNGNATPSPALMNDRTMKMLMVKGESSNSSATKSFRSHNSTSTEKKAKQLRQYVIKECTSPGILKNPTKNIGAPSPKTSKMVNFAENLTHTKLYRIGDALYDDYNLDEENDDELGTISSLTDVLYRPLRNCKDSIDLLADELNMNAITAELFRRIGIKSVGDLASIRMVDENDILETDCNLDKLRKTLKKYNDERRPTGLRTPSYKRRTFSISIVELLEEIRKAQNIDQLSVSDNTNECIRMSDPTVCIKKLDFEKLSDICIRTDDSLTKDEDVISSAQPILDENLRLKITNDCETAESTNLSDENAITNEKMRIDIVKQQRPPSVGIENEESDFVCTNDEDNLNLSSIPKLSEVSRSVPNLLRNTELNDQTNVAMCSPEIITSSEMEHRQDVEDDQSQTLDLEDPNEDNGRNEVDVMQRINVVIWKQAASLAARQFTIEQATIAGEKTTGSEVDTVVDNFVEMTADLLRTFVSSDCLNAFDQRRLADVCHLVSNLFTEESNQGG